MNREVLWRTLFLLLATVNLTVLAVSYTGYSAQFSPLNTSLMEEFDAALQDNAAGAYAGMYASTFGRSNDVMSQLKSLHPPFWKTARHQEYITLADELRSMEPQVRQPAVAYSTDTLRASYSAMPHYKPADIDRMMKIMQDTQQRAASMRTQMIPRYKEKLDRLKVLGHSLS